MYLRLTGGSRMSSRLASRHASLCLLVALPSFPFPSFADARPPASVNRAQAEAIMERVTRSAPYSGSTYDELPDDGGDKAFYQFQIMSKDAGPADPVSLDYVAISRKTGRIIVMRAEYCYAYPVRENDRPLNPGKEGDLPAECEALDQE